MQRKKQLVVLAHCLLNTNAKVVGLSTYAGGFAPLVSDLLQRGIGILQLPCPEMTYLGLKRWGMTREQYDTHGYRSHCRGILLSLVTQIQEYLANGYSFEGVVGVDGSPSCGVNVTCFGYSGGEMDQAAEQHRHLREGPGRGVMFEILSQMLTEHGITLPFSAVREKDPLAPSRP
jgi:predicted secreted protein